MKKLISLTLITLLIACNTQKEDAAGLEYTRDELLILKDLKNLDEFEDAEIVVDEDHTHLKIYLENGKHINESNDFKNGIGKAAMKLVLNSIKDHSDFSQFTVIFVVEKEYDGTPMRSENPFPYQLEDLK